MVRETATDCPMLRADPRMEEDELARAVSVRKRFGDLVAVASASCTFRKRQIHAVCGENGAGKSTLLKIVAGLLLPDEGHVEIAGSPLRPHTPREAIARGVGMVLQHFALVPVLTALENVVLGSEPTSAFGVLDLDTARSRVEKIARDLGVELPLDERVEDLGVGDRQRIEIARTLYRDARLLILDEPTAVLTKTEAAALYQTLRRLADAGKGVVVVTHKMDEVRAHADVVTVLRRGELLFTRAIDRTGDVKAQVDEVTAAIMGSSAGGESAPRQTPTDGETLLEVKDAVVGRALAGVSIALRAGEIVGVAGVEGNGQRELVALLAGDIAPDQGEITGGPVTVVHEDRQHDGLVLDASLRDNLLLGELGSFSNALGILDRSALEREAQARFASSGAKGDLAREARTLSGGNQQKIVLARALARVAPARSRVLVAAQPTRGVDLGASRDVRERLREAARNGAAVLVVSADLDELRELAHRILVIARGKIVAELPPETSDEDFGRRMLGLDETHA